MRFNWRSHLVVTALTAMSMLGVHGCSSQQQQVSDQVEASEQGEGDENAQANAETNGEEGNVETNGNEMAENEAANTQGENMATNENMATENMANEGQVAEANPEAAEGELQEIINEMGGNGAPAEVPAEAVATEEIPAAPIAEVPAEQPMAEPAAPQAMAQASSTPGLPEMGSKMPYLVEVGDTLGKIAAKIYGDQNRWRDISDLTGLSNPNQIYPGDVVYFSMDEASSTFAATYASVKRGKEVVRDGDTLATIAKRVYGSSKAWRHIWRQNDTIDNPDQLTAGMTIYYVEKDFISSASNNASAKDGLTIKTTMNKNLKKSADLTAKSFTQTAAKTIKSLT